MNPRAAINDLHPFQGCPFSLLGTSANYKKYASSASISINIGLRLYSEEQALQRRGWDSNPRALPDKRFSRPPRCDHFDTSPNPLTHQRQLVSYQK